MLDANFSSWNFGPPYTTVTYNTRFLRMQTILPLAVGIQFDLPTFARAYGLEVTRADRYHEMLSREPVVCSGHGLLYFVGRVPRDTIYNAVESSSSKFSGRLHFST